VYSFLKLIHLGSLIFWLGPALGSWFVLRYSQKNAGEQSETTQLIYKVFFFTVTLEHIALLTLLLSGVWMAAAYGLFQAQWLQYKIVIIALFVLPLEIFDIWLGNWKLKKLIEKRGHGGMLSEKESRLVHFYHGTFTNIAIVLIPFSVLIIMWLAIAKQVPF